MIIAGLVATAGCAQQDQYGPKQGVGTLGGAALGGLLGSQFGSGRGKLVTTAVGVLIGALAGSEVGKSLDRADRVYADKAISSCACRADRRDDPVEQSEERKPWRRHAGPRRQVRRR